MKILSIVIKNYRQYRDLTLDFERPGKDGHDLNVLVGKNGFGKTNLANAFCWCLWNKEPDIAQKDRNSGKPIYNLAAMEACRSARKSLLEVYIAIRVELENRKVLMAVRRCKCSVNGTVEEPVLAVMVKSMSADGDAGCSFSGADAQEEIDRYYPSDLSDYLVFDGERLTTYFQRGQETKIQQTVTNLSGIRKLDEAIEHHKMVMEEMDATIAGSSTELQAAQRKRAEAAQEYENNEDATRRYGQEIEESNVEINRLREMIGTHANVPELLEKKDQLEKRLTAIESRIKGIRDRKCQLIREYYPVLVAMKYAPTLRAYVAQKQRRQEYPPSIKREVFDEILKADKCLVCGEPLSEESRKFVEAQIEKYNKTVVSTETYKAINDLIEPKITTFVERMRAYLERRDAVLRDEFDCESAHETAATDLQDVRDKLAAVNDAQSYKSMVVELAQREHCQTHARDMLGSCRAKRIQLFQEKQAAEAEYERVRLASDRDASRRRQRGILSESLKVLSETRGRMINEIREAIEKTANDYWRRLMWKPAAEIGTIHFALNFSVSLVDGDTGQKLLGTLSAAERAMLALSITWSLHSQAGVNFPFIIDTPVANMSSDSRRDFAETLAGIAKDKQVVLLFTDTEYINEIREVFEPKLNSYKTLSYADGQTEIK